MPIVVRIDVELAKRKMSVGGILRACRAHAGERRGAEERSRQGCSFQHSGCHVPGAGLPAR